MTPTLRRRLATVLVVMDVILINIAFGVAYYLRYELQWFRDLDPSTYRSFDAYVPFAMILTIVLLFAYRLDGAYDIRRDSSLVEEAYRITAGTATAIITHNAPIAALADRVVTLSGGLVKEDVENPNRRTSDEIVW